MKKIYLDFNVIANISSGLFKSNQKYLAFYNKLLELKNTTDIHFYYSLSHIFESHARNNLEKTNRDLEVIKEITNGDQLQLNKNNNIVTVNIDPFKQYNAIIPIHELIKDMKEVHFKYYDYSDIIELKNYGLSNDRLHKISADKIVTELEKFYIEIDKKMSAQEKIELNKKLYNKLIANFDSYFRDFKNILFNYLKNYITMNNMQVIKSILDNILRNQLLSEIEKIKNSAACALSHNFIESLSNILKSNNIGIDLIPGSFQHFLALSNYIPDTEKTKKKKGALGDIEDSMHLSYACQCDIFITNDKRFLQRSKAVINYLKNSLLIYNENQFIEHIVLN